MKSNTQLAGIILCLIASISWGAMFPVADHALTYIDPLFFTLIRYGSVTLLLVIILFIKEGKTAFRFEGKFFTLLIFGVAGFTVYNILIFLGQHMMGRSGVVVASIMESIMPMLSILIIWMYKKVKPENYQFITISCAFIGAFIVVTNGSADFASILTTNLFPILFMLIAVIGWCIYSMGGESVKDWSTLRYSTLTCLLGTITTGLITLVATAFHIIDVPSLEVIYQVRYDMTFMILFPGLIALLAWNKGIKILSPVSGILFINFVPVTTLVVVMLQGHPISLYEVFGTALVIYALTQNNLYQRKQQNKTIKQMSLDHSRYYEKRSKIH
ncbi:DMT family transporter [Peribacillus asahii]|uniref:DMT family transporter n=1 Tax=Peribacillus asahii TaxID=228899 RepID=A0A398B6G1_9BACI|nr:DMT family transporter [Peribacillus asahii]RID85141.1 DMT family transporter [Peribacillus asahii]